MVIIPDFVRLLCCVIFIYPPAYKTPWACTGYAAQDGAICKTIFHSVLRILVTGIMSCKLLQAWSRGLPLHCMHNCSVHSGLKLEFGFLLFNYCRTALLTVRFKRTKIATCFFSSFSRNRRKLLKNGSIFWNKKIQWRLTLGGRHLPDF